MGKNNLEEERWYRFHDLVTLSVVSCCAGLLGFLEHEFGEYAVSGPVREPDVRVFIGARVPDCSEGTDHLSFDDQFRRLGRMRYVIAGVDKPCTEIYTWPDWTPALYPAFAGTFLQTSVIEPVLYLKCLQRDCLLLHAACISEDGRSCLFAASGGSGKTTMALRLAQGGFVFLGDDLVFVRTDGMTLAYPRPLHLFSHVIQTLPGLHLSLRLRFLLRFKDVVRAIMTTVTGERWMIATRVPIERIVPEVRMGQVATLDKVFLLVRQGKIRQLDISTAEGREQVAARIVGGGDINKILVDHLLRQRPELQAWALRREQELAQYVLARAEGAYAINPRAFEWQDYEKLLGILRVGGFA
jgi:hypothetical protein